MTLHLERIKRCRPGGAHERVRVASPDTKRRAQAIALTGFLLDICSSIIYLMRKTDFGSGGYLQQRGNVLLLGQSTLNPILRDRRRFGALPERLRPNRGACPKPD